MKKACSRLDQMPYLPQSLPGTFQGNFLKNPQIYWRCTRVRESLQRKSGFL